MPSALSILGVGIYLPPARSVREMVTEAGGDLSHYKGWAKACIARENDHPSTMASQALESALSEAGISRNDLKLVLSVGVSRDYLPGWSLATAVMEQHKIPHTCLGLDILLGCNGVLTGLNLVQGWLQTQGGGFAAIVSGERWSQTVDRRNSAAQSLWAHADGGSAAIVGLGAPRSLVEFRGAEFRSASAYNDLIVIKYGGTRFPVAPPGESPHIRHRKPIPGDELWGNLRLGYTRVFGALRQRFPGPVQRLLCSNISPDIVKMVGEIAEVPDERSCIFGHETGHVGSSDLLIGLRKLLDGQQIDGSIAMAVNTPYAFCAGMLGPRSS